MGRVLSRREWIWSSAGGAVALLLDRGWARAQVPDGLSLALETLDFIVRCGRADGGYAPSPDPAYAGESDTKFSDLAAVTYAAVLARTMGWDLPRRERSIAFIRGHQQPDGRFVNLAGKHDPASDLAILYNTTQGVVGLRALGAEPEIDPIPSIEQLLAGDAYRKLPWYTVESRCGAVASSDDHTPFPHPAHRTGQADFPHPALGQGLCNRDLPTPPST